MAYTTINKSTAHFKTLLYSGSGSARTVTGVGFQPDFFWIKQRTSNQGHLLWDATRGGNYYLPSSNNSASAADVGTFTTASDGYTLGTDAAFNGSGQNYVGWNWKANGQGSSNTDGTINTTYTSANATAGFSVSLYTGTGSNASIGHGLGKKPGMFIIKRTNATEDWAVYHQKMTASHYLNLNTTATQETNNRWNGEPTSSLINLATHAAVNASGSTYVCYAFADITGYSKFGRYFGTGNATTPAFVYTGFKPKFIIVKNNDQNDSWFIHDDLRDGYNDDNEYLFTDLNNAEGSNVNRIRILSNGFSVPTTDKSHNVSGNEYFYMAFGQTLVGSNNVCATAR